MSPQDIPDTDREALSALFDGALQGDARRFAARRLAHDTAWQEECGRWQLIGDAMRRQAPIVAPADFAARVERAIAAEAASVPMPVVANAARRPVRLWAGAALAASLAALAVFATRSPAPTPASIVQPVVASQAAAASEPKVAAVSMTPAAAVAVEPPVSTATPSAPVERIAAVDRPAARAFARAPRRSAGEPRATVTREPSAVLAASTFTPPDARNPFHVPASDPLASRPWPRAALSGSAALTASYGAAEVNRGDSPSFYPFEPRTRAETEVRAESP